MQPGSPPAIAHGEVIPDENRDHGWLLKDTLATPDAPAVDASIARTELLLSESFDVAALAIDAANSIPNATSLEQALAHQAALCHKAAFEITAKAMTLAQRIGSSRPAHIEQAASVETTRLLNAAARMMSAYQQALLTLQRLRHGGEQRVLVQHVNVGAGGQAVVGAIRTGGCQPEGGKRK